MKFRELPMHVPFEFEGTREFTSMAQGPWVRISVRRYARADQPTSPAGGITVGTLNAAVVFANPEQKEQK